MYFSFENANPFGLKHASTFTLVIVTDVPEVF